MSAVSYAGQLAAALRFVESHDRFLVVSHVNPDGDAISSTCAVGWLLEQLGKTVVMVNENRVPEKFMYLRGADRIRSASVEPVPDERFDAVISVDCADYTRMGCCVSWFTPEVQLLNIDHHPTNDGFGELTLIRSDAAATAEILFEWFKHASVKWDKESATCIYTGLLTDTGGFRYANTTPNVMKTASELLQYGVDGAGLAEHLLESLTHAHIQLLKRALATLEFEASGQVAWMVIREQDMRETEAVSEDSEGLVNYPRNIEGVQVGILFKEVTAEKVKISMRSAGKVDVAALAHSLGGGGHVRAAGVTLHGKLEDCIRQVIARVKQELQ